MPEIVDLSQEIYHKQPVHELHQSTSIWTHHTYEEGAAILGDSLGTDDPPWTYSTKSLLMNDHGPTHVDAFAHLGPGGESIDEMSLSYFFGPGKAIEISKYDGASDEVITPADMETACDEAGVEIEDGDILLVNTGHYQDTHPTKAYVDDYIGFSREAAEWMVDQGVKNFGVDAPGPDNSNDLTFPTHQVGREEGVPHMENLKNIDEVVGESFTFYGFPLKIRDGTGGPMRAVAMLDD
ncbi:cyclase family protein [Halorientalis pallida]|uniref:Cyclase family protein n=1 Tax=Halorientalis pallida TaxID=2479928 RepID=A0A498KY66_9EURY|nr:cyclase family protein [Halorientalis pallida]RXK47892.1 cyclase family protein [Halorientalis pallida]